MLSYEESNADIYKYTISTPKEHRQRKGVDYRVSQTKLQSMQC